MNAQIIRRAIHLFFGGIIIGLYFLSSREIMLYLTGIIMISGLLMEILRFKFRKINDFLFTDLKFLFKKEEKRHTTGATYLAIGFFTAVVLFSREIAIIAIMFATVGDALAAMIGAKYGRTKLNSKSIEGGFVFFVASFLAGVLLLNALDVKIMRLVLGAIAATLTELFFPYIDDNLTVPIMSGIIMSLV